MKRIVYIFLCLLVITLTLTALVGCKNDGENITVTDKNEYGEGSAALSDTLSMPKVFASGMVLQRQKPINIFGYAPDGASVSVTLGDATGNATSVGGKWTVTLPAMEAAKDLTLTVSSGNEVLSFTSVDIGEVLVISGQSNAQYAIYQLEDWDEIKRLAETYKNVRVFCETSDFLINEHAYGFGEWFDATPANLSKNGVKSSILVSAVGYVAAARLAEELGPEVSVGLINVTRSATSVDAWISEGTMNENPTLYGAKPAILDSYQEFYEKNGRLPASINDSPYYVAKNLYHFMPSVCYNAMIAPLVGFTARSVIWYQGESDVTTTSTYAERFEAMRRDYVRAFSNEELAFFIIQLAPYNSTDPLASFEAIQYNIAHTTPNTYIVPTGIDGAPFDRMDILYGPPPSVIHPSRKTPLAYRAADMILHELYGRTDIAVAPKLLSVKGSEGKVTLTFDGEIYLLRGISPTDFEVKDKNGVWHTVTGFVDGSTVVLDTSRVNSPTEVRYGFGERLIELKTGELLPLAIGSGLTLSADGKTVIYNYGGTYREFTVGSGEILRTVKAGNITNASGSPLPTFVAPVN